MKTGFVQSAFIANTTRLDGGFHLSEGITVRSLIAKSPYSLVKIGEVTESVYCPGIFHRNYVSSGTPFLGGADIQKMDYDTGKYLRESTTPNHEILAVKKDWTLVTCGGTIGETAYVNEDLAKCWLSQHIMRVIPNVSKIKEGFLYAYLASKQGKSLLTTNIYGSVIPTLNAGSIKQILIPLFPAEFQNKIDAQIKEVAALRVEANKLLEEAKTLLIKEAGLRELTPEDYDYYGPRVSGRKVSCFVRNKKDIDTTTINAFNHSERIRKTKASMPCQTVPLKDVLIGGDTFSTGAFPRIELKGDKGIMLINQSDIFDTIIKGKHIASYCIKKQNMVEYGEVLVAGVGTLGESETFCRTIFANEDLVGQLISGEFIRMKTNDNCPSGYLFAWLSSDYAFRFIRSTQAGTKLCRPIPKLFLQIPVPILSKEIMNAIDEKVRKAHTLRYKANTLERSAIEAVEKEIDSWSK